jgi:hypothetical protein
MDVSAESQYHAWQKEADSYYEKGDYSAAYKKYLNLAKKGDSFSQYRVSFMNLQAQGVKSEDIVEAFAWSVLAAQNGQPDLVKYRKAVSAMVPENQRRKAERKIDYYMRRWGNIAIAQDAIVGARKQTRDCTGSRLGMRCDEVYAAQMPTFWSTNPGLGDGSDGGSAAPSGSVSAAQTGVGGRDGRDLAYYQALRDQIATLNRYIEENTGKVEIGELEVIEDTAEPGNGSGQP